MSGNSMNPAMVAPVLLEPRIMMDANLEWDLASTTALSGSLSDLVQNFAEQYANLAEGETEAAGLPAGVIPDSAPQPGNLSRSHDLEPVMQAAERVQLAFSALRPEVFESSRDLIRPDDGNMLGTVSPIVGSAFLFDVTGGHHLPEIDDGASTGPVVLMDPLTASNAPDAAPDDTIVKRPVSEVLPVSELDKMLENKPVSDVLPEFLKKPVSETPATPEAVLIPTKYPVAEALPDFLKRPVPETFTTPAPATLSGKLPVAEVLEGTVQAEMAKKPVAEPRPVADRILEPRPAAIVSPVLSALDEIWSGPGLFRGLEIVDVIDGNGLEFVPLARLVTDRGAEPSAEFASNAIQTTGPGAGSDLAWLAKITEKPVSDRVLADGQEADSSLDFDELENAALMAAVAGLARAEVSREDQSAGLDGAGHAFRPIAASLMDGMEADMAAQVDLSYLAGESVGDSHIINGFADFNALALLNDPAPLLEGIYDIFQEIDSFFEDFLADIDLPIIGDALGTGLTFFDDVMNSVILPALAYAETPQPDGSLPSTIDLINGFVNETLNDVFGTDDVEYLHAFLDTSGSTSESFIYGAINFSGKLFSEMLDIDFDFGIPGLNIEVEEGSEILLELSYTVNIGFGMDIDGFFLLNDTDDAEVSIDFLVDAGTFSGSMSVLNLLGLSAQAVTLDDDGIIISDASTDGGTAQLHAFLEADLYGDTGTEIERDFSNIEPLDGSGNVLAYENIIYLNELDFGELVTFDFGAEVDVYIGVVGNILDPFSGDPLTVGGFQILPDVAAELVLDASYTLQDGLSVDALGIHNVRVDATQLYDALIRPTVDPIMAWIGPFLDVIDIIFQDPIGLLKDLAVDLISIKFPIVRKADNVAEVANSIAQFAQDLADAGGMVQFGSFDLTEYAAGLASGEINATEIDVTTLEQSGETTDDGSGDFGTFGDYNRGFSVSIPLISDPFAAIQLLLGDFSGVELARARYTLFDFDTEKFNLIEPILGSLDAPDWVITALETANALAGTTTGATAELSGTAVTRFEVGYDLSGLQGFLDSYDPLRLLDGVFIESSPGSLLDVDMAFAVGLVAVAAGIEGAGVVDFEVNLKDPNDDGKLRIAELLDVVINMIKAGAVTPHQQIAYLLEGELNFDLLVNLFYGVGPFKTEVPIYDLALPEITLDLYQPEPTLVGDMDGLSASVMSLDGILSLLGFTQEELPNTQILNMGARIIAANSTDMQEDGDDILTLGSAASAYSVELENADGTLSGAIREEAGAVVIPAGNGDNVIDMSAFSDAQSERVTLTYTGTGQDTITLPVGGLNVVFSGAGDDVIRAPADAQGTYIIFAEGGADTIDIPGGNVIVFSGDDYGMRDVFLEAFAQGDVTPERVRELLGLLDDDTPDSAATGYYNVGGGAPVNLEVLLENYTEISQLKAERDDEAISVGAGNHILLTGKGDDVIRGDIDGAGEVTVLSGAGDDDIAIGGTTVFIEGGAGSDTIEVNGQTVEVWGWGKAAGERGGLGAASEIDALASKDGDDIIIGGSGDDQLYGQIGDDLIEGNGGNDTIGGGLGDDVIAGGTFAFTQDGAVLDIRDVDIAGAISGVLDIRVIDAADGDDTIRGGSGDDILLGGGGADTISGSGGRDLISGDFASVLLTGNIVAQRFASLYEDSANQGADNLDGGAMDDILMGGGGSDILRAPSGDNVLVGDFGSIDGADIRSAIDSIVSISSALGGNDTLTSGRGNDRLVGGEADDVLDSGLGVDMLFGDNGSLDFADGVLNGHALDTDGDDTLIMGENLSGVEPAPVDQNDLAFGGLGDDTVFSDVGGLTLIGDSGEMVLRDSALQALAQYADPGASPSDAILAQARQAWFLFDALVETARTHADTRDGNDRVEVVGGTNMLALGGGDDAATLSAGLNHVLADDGVMRTLFNADESIILYEMVSTDMVAASGQDHIVAADGDNIIIGGEQGDLIEAGDGFNQILGDRGSYLSSTDQSMGYLRSDASLLGGDDRITTGAGNAIIIAGQGDDTVFVGSGDDVAAGDDAEVTHSHGWDILTLDTSNHASGGNDMLTAGGTTGDNVLIGQTGDDSIDGGLDDDLLAGDNADLDFLSVKRAFTGQSALDRLVGLESVTPQVDGDDVLRGDTGTDYLIGGFGDDELFGGGGQDFLIGDTAIIVRAYSVDGTGLGGELWIDTNFAYETGGYDLLRGEAGFDVMIGNLGPDLFFGNTEEDALFSDGFAGYFTTHWDSDLFNQVTPHWQLVTVNFAGPGAIDIVSKAQSASSIGLSLDQPADGSERSRSDTGLAGLPDTSADRFALPGIPASQLDMLMDYMMGDMLMSAIAQLMAMGLDGEALRAAIAADLEAFMSQSSLVDGVTRALLLERVMMIIEDRLQLGQSAASPPYHSDQPMMVAAE